MILLVRQLRRAGRLTGSSTGNGGNGSSGSSRISNRARLRSTAVLPGMDLSGVESDGGKTRWLHWKSVQSSTHREYHRSSSLAQSLQQSKGSSPPSPLPLLPSKVLVANRGEIACRVMATCRKLGVPTVALYSPADGPHALHASLADEAYPIGHGSSPSESYLLQEAVLDIAKRSGATAIHPGYGFLSENADFCERIQQESNLAFVGPPPSAIAAMGSKSRSKEIMEEAGVTTAPGFYGDTEEEQEPLYLLEQAKRVGFPLLIKAIAGGGGKGMRLVESESDFLDNLQSCRREAETAFGNPIVLLERYLVNPRHVEVQIVADAHGNVVSLHERDCSLQRRHQKVLEEAPASDLRPELRAELGAMARRAAQAVGYVNAGTVEFLLEANPEAPHGYDFYFCEMNTRLQVEHPVTELITGIDLVEWQLRVAGGQELPLKDSSDIPCAGHAIEARIYAETPRADGSFLPAAGTVWHHDPPTDTPNVGLDRDFDSTNGIVRVDTGIQKGAEVGVYYDPMICKLIVHGESRDRALDKLVGALKDYRIAGVPTNIDFLIRCAEHPTFREPGATTTGFLDDHLAEVLPGTDEVVPDLGIALASVATLLVCEKRVGITNLPESRRTQTSPWNSWAGSWRNIGNLSQTLTLADGTRVGCTSLRDGSFDILVTPSSSSHDEGEDRMDPEPVSSPSSFHVQATLSSDQKMEVLVDGTQKYSLDVAIHETNGMFRVGLWPHSAALRNAGHYFWEVPVPHPKALPASESQDASLAAGGASVTAPMPGKISSIAVQAGDSVRAGDILVVLEAMKMEHTIKASVDGIVASLGSGRVGDVVANGAVLVVLEGPDDAEDADDDEIDESKAV